MDWILSSHRFSDSEICLINYCRLYLQAVTISDIAEANGQWLDRSFLDGCLSHYNSSRSRLQYTNQQRPPRSAWKLWRKANHLWATPSGRLRTPLGHWLYPESQLRRIWPNLCSKSSRQLFRHTEHGTIRAHVQSLAGPYLTESYAYTTTLPDDVEPVGARLDVSGYHSSRPCGLPLDASGSPGNTFLERLNCTELWEYELLHGVTINCSLNDFLNCLLKLHLEWQLAMVLFGETTQPVMDGLSLLTTVNHSSPIVALPGDTAPPPSELKDTGYCLCGLLQRIRANLTYSRPYPNETLKPDWDAVNEICSHLRRWPNAPALIHVKGHQDETNQDDLSGPAKLNIMADELAESYHQYPHSHYLPRVIRLQNNPIQFPLSGGTITGRIGPALRTAADKRDLWNSLRDKYHWTDDTMSVIDWTAHDSAHQSQSQLCHQIMPRHSAYQIRYSSLSAHQFGRVPTVSLL